MSKQEIWVRAFNAAIQSVAIYNRSNSSNDFLEKCVQVADFAVKNCPDPGYRESA